jgi:hypothetical protein
LSPATKPSSPPPSTASPPTRPCARFGAAGRARILAEFSIDAMVAGNLAVYRQVLAMKIITVLHSLRSGGAERHALQLMRGLRARGHEALFAGSMNGWLGQQLTADGFGGINLPMVGIYDLPSVIRLALYARREKADLIHGHLTRGAVHRVCREAGGRAQRGHRPLRQRRQALRPGRPDHRRVGRRGALSEREATTRAHPGRPSRHRRHRRQAARQRAPRNPRGAGPRRRRAVPADGRPHRHRQGPRHGPEGAGPHQGPRWTLLLAGDHHGDLGPQIQALATELGIADRVRFLGLREDVPALLAAADMLLAPSRRRPCP